MTGESNKELLARIHELEATCRLWIAANQAKDERLRELEVECNQLRLRVSRLGRQVERRQKTASRCEVHAFPSKA